MPAPGPDEVLIRVGAAGVNFADVMRAHGTYHDGPRAPYLAGFEAAGEIVAVGAAVTGHTLGTHVIGTASAAKHEVVRALGADHVVDHRTTDAAAEVLRLTGGSGADLVLESVGGATFRSSLAATRRVTGRVVVYGVAGGDAAPAMFTQLMAELATLRGAGVHTPGQPTVYDLVDGPKALAELAAGVTVGKLALRP